MVISGSPVGADGVSAADGVDWGAGTSVDGAAGAV